MNSSSFQGDQGRGGYRSLWSSLWQRFHGLSSNARLVLLAVRTGPQGNAAGIAVQYIEPLTDFTGLSVAKVKQALSELEASGWIKRDGQVIWDRHGLYDDPTTRLTNEKHRKAVLRALHELPPSPLIAEFCRTYGIDMASDSLSIGLPKASEGHAEGKAVACEGPLLSYSDSDPDSDTERDSDSEQRSPVQELPGGQARQERTEERPLPAEFSPMSEDREYARRLGIIGQQFATQVRLFVQYFTDGKGRGRTAVDWHAEFRTWLLREKNFSEKRAS